MRHTISTHSQVPGEFPDQSKPLASGDPALERLARLVRELAHVPMICIVLLDGTDVRVESYLGFNDRDTRQSMAQCAKALCQALQKSDAPILISDVGTHPLLFSGEVTSTCSIIAHAGIPLRATDGQLLGALWVMDTTVRNWNAEEVNTLFDCAALVLTEIELRRTIAERNRAEAEWHRREEHYELITNNTSDVISIIDQTGCYSYVSPSYQHVLGYEPATLIGTSAFDLIHPDDFATIQEQWQHLTTGNSVQVVFRYRHADGTWRWFEANGTATEYKDVYSIVAIGRDINERKRLEAQLLQAQKMESIGLLAGGIAHDFNNLLTVIRGYVDLTYQTIKLDDAVRHDLRQVLKATDRASTLTRQLLAFARKQIIAPQVLNLNDLILDIDTLLRRLIAADISLMTLPGMNLWMVKADPAQIEQVLVNLVVNARDAMPHGGQIIIETANVVLDQSYTDQHAGSVAGEYVMITVSDTGVGMSEQVQARVFEPFFSTKRPGEGSGLGLATCYGIVKQHSGYITLYSEPGHGTVATIYLPRVAIDSIGDRKPLPKKETESVGGTETILLVEDDPAVRLLATRVLREQGYNILEASNGEEALQLAQAQPETPIHLLFTDVVMPQIGGKALAERLILLRPNLKVLFTSGYTNKGIVQYGQLKPGVMFLQKPFTPAALVYKVRKVLDK